MMRPCTLMLGGISAVMNRSEAFFWTIISRMSLKSMPAAPNPYCAASDRRKASFRDVSERGIFLAPRQENTFVDGV